jgi:hypothetical protein
VASDMRMSEGSSSHGRERPRKAHLLFFFTYTTPWEKPTTKKTPFKVL